MLKRKSMIEKGNEVIADMKVTQAITKHYTAEIDRFTEQNKRIYDEVKELQKLVKSIEKRIK